MKEILSQITIIVFVTVPVLLLLAAFIVTIKLMGDRQTKSFNAYEKQYTFIQILIRELIICNQYETFLGECIKELEKMSYKNPEKTNGLWLEFERKFKKIEKNDPEMCSNDILEEVSAKTNIPIEEILGQSRKRKIADARLLLYRRLKECGYKDKGIAEITHRGQRSTVTLGRKQTREVPYLLDQYDKYYPKK